MLATDIQQRIRNLSPAKRQLLAQRLAERASQLPAATNGAIRSTHARLIAYATVRAGSSIRGEELRLYLKDRLPDYMVPAECVIVDDLPRLPNGKLDRKALLAQTIQHAVRHDTAPATQDGSQPALKNAVMSEIVQKLTTIWAEVLGFAEINLNDNFFEVGGDSILSIQIVAKANKAGIRLSPTQIFDHPTIGELATVLESTTVVQAPVPQIATTQLVTGEVILTPIQHWLLEQNLNVPQHWNQAILLQTPPDLNSDTLEQAVQHLLLHHDALRMRFEKSSTGWVQINSGAELSIKLHRFDLSTVGDDEIRRIIELHATKIQSAFVLKRGPLLAAAHFVCGKLRHSFLLLVAHHLVIDAVSWGILLEDLATCYTQLLRQEKPQLFAKSTSFQQWAKRLQEAAQSEDIRKEFAHWQRVSQSATGILPLDYTGIDLALANRNQSQRTFAIALDEASTHALLHESTAAYHTQVSDLLLAALAKTITGWTGRSSLLFGMEGHGREAIVADLDLSRLVGWLTSYFPVELRLEANDSPGALLKSVKEQLRQTPNRGIGYGLLRYLSDDVAIRAELARLPSPPLLFNYLGQMDRQRRDYQPFTIAEHALGLNRHPADLRPVIIEINARVEAGQLQIEWAYSENLHQRQTIERLATAYRDALQALIAHCISGTESGYTPSDFPLAAVDQPTLDSLLALTAAPVCDFYPLSPMQELMLVATAASAHSDRLVTQARYRLHGKLDVAAFQRAWQMIIDRHSALRTSFVWQGLPQPLQRVHAEATLPFAFHDLGQLAPSDREVVLAQMREAEHHQRFDLAQPPLMRVTLVKLAADNYEMLWNCHHLVVDRWCNGIILRELLEIYEAMQQGKSANLSPAPAFADYIGWLHRQSWQQAEEFWRGEIGQISEPTLLTAQRRMLSVRHSATAEQTIGIAKAEVDKLRNFVRSQNLTLSTLIHGGLALLLASYTGQQKVILGTTVSGRPSDLSAVDAMVGSFINNLPLAVTMPTEQSILDWLQQLQRQLARLQGMDFVSPAMIQSWSQLASHLPLFDLLLVFQKGDRLATNTSAGFQIEERIGTLQTNFPLTLAVAELEEELQLRAAFHIDRFAPSDVTQLLQDLSQLLLGLVENAWQPLAKTGVLRPNTLSRSATTELEDSIGAPSPQIRNVPTVETLVSDSALTLRLKKIWQQELRLAQVGVTESYFELGGTSLQAMHLFTRINQELGSNLSLTALIHAPTIRQLALLLGDRPDTALKWSPLVPLQTQGSNPPFFCIHGITGDVLWFRELGSCLAPDQPLFGIQARGLDGAHPPIDSIAEMARSYIAAIKEIEPQGPYYFGGASFGGTVALEMAQQLQANGDSIGLLVMFDHAPVRNSVWQEKRVRTATLGRSIAAFARALGNVPFWLQSMVELGWAPTMARLRRKVRLGIKRWLGNDKSTAAADLLDYGDQLPAHRQQLIEANLQALENYQPQPYPGQVTLFQARAQPLFSTIRPSALWHDFSGDRLQVHIVPGSHEGMFRAPNVTQVAQLIRNAMKR